MCKRQAAGVSRSFKLCVPIFNLSNSQSTHLDYFYKMLVKLTGIVQQRTKSNEISGTTIQQKKTPYYSNEIAIVAIEPAADTGVTLFVPNVKRKPNSIPK